MKNIAEVSVTIKAPSAKVWEWLTKPELVNKYFFGTHLHTDWSPGSPILFRGEWQGKPYEDKGKVLEFRKEEHLAYLYWSNFSGTPDALENYEKITFDLSQSATCTTVVVRQECTNKEHIENNWRSVLDGLKKAIEG